MDPLPADKRSPFETLVCGGLGYCCPYAFLRVNKQTGMIAARLGVTERTVRLWKARFNSGELKCQNNSSTDCLLPSIRALGK